MKAILKHVGEVYWPWPQDHIAEMQDRGPSIRIAPDSIPDLEPPYPVMFIHPRGTFHVSMDIIDIIDLWNELGMERHIPTDADIEEYINFGLPTLAFIAVFRFLDGNDQVEYKRLVEKYGVEFGPAVTHYSYITGAQVVIGDQGEGLDLVDLLEGQGVVVEPVKIIRVGKEEREANENPD